jgi:hypothetical protein
MSDEKDNNPEYEVGYKRPPKSTQFPKGQSGNAKGRPKGSKNFATVLHAELNARISVTENGIRKTISKREATVKQVVNKAAAGNLPAVKMLLDQERYRDGELLPATPAQRTLSASDDLVLKNLRQRLLAIEKDDHDPDDQ